MEVTSRLLANRHKTRVDMKPPNPARNFFRGSDSGDCKRQIQYRMQGVIGAPMSPESLDRMKKGDILHDYIRGNLIPNHLNATVHCQEEEVEGELLVDDTEIVLRGHIDGIIEMHGDPARKALLEVKTTSTFGFKACLGSSFLVPGHYTRGYYRQALRYLVLWNACHPTEPPLEQICLFIYNVNGDADKTSGAPFVDYWITPDMDDFAEDVRALAEIQKHLTNGTLADRGYKESDWQCEGCSYRETCYGRDA